MSEVNRMEPGFMKLGTHGGVKNDKPVFEIPSHTIYVSSSLDLDNLTNLPAGTIAIQYGFTNIWQLKPDGTWVAVE